MKSFLAGFVKDRELAADMAQDIFFKIWINRKSVSKVASFKSYLFRMARNMIYDYYDHTLIEEKYVSKLRQKNNISAELVEEGLYAHELSLLIDAAIEKMPDRQRQIFTMSRTEGLDNDRIAKELNISKRTVENHITKALSELRKIVNTIVTIFF